MADIPKAPPIPGHSVCAVLERAFVANEQWTLSNIETLSEGNTLDLGRLWDQVRKAPIQITTQELCKALRGATQVIELDLQLAADPTRALLIEDGELVCNVLVKSSG